MGERFIGTVTHFYKAPGVAVVQLVEDGLAVGDEVHFVGHTSDFTERVTSLEMEHGKVDHASAGEEVAVKVIARVRQHDRVLKVVPD
ncbi:MAG: translation elongation factor-like protein [Gemmatimonadota bacterium]|nr:translation elongation factor-like protein [Gemmatimonadota bacterium]